MTGQGERPRPAARRAPRGLIRGGGGVRVAATLSLLQPGFPMRRSLQIVGLALAVLAPAACAPNPIVARDPVPAPGPQEAYRCRSRPTVLNAYWTDCEPVRREPEVVIRSRG